MSVRKVCGKRATTIIYAHKRGCAEMGCAETPSYRGGFPSHTHCFRTRPPLCLAKRVSAHLHTYTPTPTP